MTGNQGGQPLLELCSVTKGFVDGGAHRQIFDHIDLTLRAGESVALWGPSGSGKSTLLNIVAGVLTVDAGHVELALVGASSARESPVRYGALSAQATAWLRRRHLGYVFQFFNLIPTLTVEENIELSLRLAARTDLRPAAVARARALGLAHRLNAYPLDLSGGEQQRAAIARALAPEPVLVLADEPTGNLDAANAAAVTDALWGLAAETGCALMIATHDPQIAERADRRLDLT